MLVSNSGQSSAYSTSSLIQLPLTRPIPPLSASLIALRSIVKLTASRTRLSLNGFFGSLKPGNWEPPGTRNHRRQRQLRIVLDPIDQFARHQIDDVGFAAFEHRDAGRRLGHGNDREV